MMFNYISKMVRIFLQMIKLIDFDTKIVKNDFKSLSHDLGLIFAVSALKRH